MASSTFEVSDEEMAACRQMIRDLKLTSLGQLMIRGVRCLKQNAEFLPSADDLSNIDRHGLVDILSPANDRDSGDLLRNAKEVRLIFNDMKNWLPGPKGEGKHLDALLARLDQGLRTHIFLLHPETPYLHEIARASGKSPEEQAGEIERAVVRLCRGRIEKALPQDVIFEKRPLRITGHHWYNTYALMMFDDVAYVNTYPIAVRGSTEVGNYHVYKRTGRFEGVFERVERDLGAIQSKAESFFADDGFDLVKYYNDRGKIPPTRT
jgi:hypothetical protein